MSCKYIPKNSNSSYDFTELRAILRSYLEKFYEIDEVIPLRLEIMKMLQFIGDTYSNNLLDLLSEEIEDFLILENFIDFVPVWGVKNSLSKKFRKTFNLEINLEYFQGKDGLELATSAIAFLSNTFKKADIKKEIRQRATNYLINAFIIDRENGILVQDIQVLNQNSRNLKQKLFDKVLGGLNLPSTLLFNNTEYTGAVDNLDIQSKNILQTNINNIENLFYNDKNVYDYTIDWFILNNFDHFVNLILGEYINIHPDFKHKLTNKDIYSYNEKSNSAIKSWRDTEDVNLSEEINKLVQALLNSTPYYTFRSNQPTGLFINFEDYFRIITKIKNLALNPKSSSLRKGILGRSLRHYINKIQDNPLKYLPKVFQLLVETDWLDDLGFSKTEKNKLYSIYKGIFSENSRDKSIKFIQEQHLYTVKLYYQAITLVANSMYNVEHVLYFQKDNGVIVTKNLKDLFAEQTLQDLKIAISFKNTRKSKFNFEMTDMLPWKALPVLKNKVLDGIKYSISLSNGLTLNVETSNLGEYISYRIVENGLPILADKLDAFYNDYNILDFIFLQTGLNLNKDLNLKNHLKNECSLSELLHLSSSILFNKYISNVELKRIKGVNNLKKELNMIYGESRFKPDINSYLNEINLTSNALLHILSKIANIKSILMGQVDSLQVMDSEKKQQSLQTLTRVLGSLPSQLERIKELNAPGHEFSLIKLPGLYLGFYNIKDAKLEIGNKQHTDFSVSELSESDFLYNFVNGFIYNNDKNLRQLIINGKIGLITSTNSDKNTNGIALWDLNMPSPLGKKWIELTDDELIQITCQELLGYYQNIHNRVLADFLALSEFHSGTIIDPYNNFKVFNEESSKLGMNSYLRLMELVKDYNKHNPNSRIEIVDLVHCVVNKDSIIYNNTLRSLIARYSNINEFKKFLKLKQLDLLKSLIDSKFEINLFNSIADTPQAFLQQQKDWVLNDKMVLAKITFEGVEYNISNKYELDNLSQKIGISFSKNLHSLYNLLVKLHPMLVKYLNFDGIFSQEFLLSSVGSHIAHKSGVTHKIPILYRSTEQLNSIVNHRALKVPKELFTLQDVPAINLKETQLKLWEYYKKKATIENKFLVTDSSLMYLLNDTKGDFSEMSDTDADFYILKNEIAEESSRYLAQNKRNSDLTAQIYSFQPNQIDGIPTHYNIATYRDIRFNLYTINGEVDSAKPLDGSTIVHPMVVHWENASLDENKVGIDKKPYFHFYNYETGTGGNIKTAGFAITNDLIKRDKTYRIVVKNMMNMPYLNRDGSVHIMEGKGILQDFDGNNVIYQPIYYKKGTKFYKRNILSYEGNNNYLVEDILVDIEGNAILDKNNTEIKLTLLIPVNSNYELWQLFGGYNSYLLDKDTLELVHSETSILNSVKASNTYGIKLDPSKKILDATDLYQPLKYSDIHYLCNEGAIKMSPANINTSDCLYKEIELNYFTVPTVHGGVLLDKEHHADNSELSLMTLVMSAAASRGYTKEIAAKLYKALSSLTKTGTKEFRDALGNITKDSVKFDAAVAKIIVDTILHSNNEEGLLHSIVTNLMLSMKQDGKLFELTEDFVKKFNQEVPFSHRGIYKQFITTLSSVLSKAGIKLKLSGNLAVLKPTQDFCKLYKIPVIEKLENGTISYVRDAQGKIVWRKATYGQLENFFTETINTEEDLLNSYLELIPSIEPVDIEIGHNYIISYNNDTETILQKIYIEMPHSLKNNDGTFNTNRHGYLVYGYKDLKDLKKLFPNLEIKEDITQGLDLQSYNVTFRSENGDKYQTADLDIILDFFELKKIKNEYSKFLTCLNYLLKYDLLNVYLQYILTDLYLYNIESKKTNAIINELENLKQLSGLELINGILNLYNKTGSLTNSSLYYKYLALLAEKVLNGALQYTLNSISPTGSLSTVLIDGKPVTIDKSSIKVQSFGAIVPKVFESSLNLSRNADLQEIKYNKDYFVELLIDKFTTKVDNYINYDEDNNEIKIYNYHLELKRNNGNHLYIRAGKQNSDLKTKLPIDIFVDEDGKVYRRDNKGNIIHPLYSVNDEVWLDYKGNEIILTQTDVDVWEDSNQNQLTVFKDKDGSYYVATTNNRGNDVKLLLELTKNGYLNTSTGEMVVRRSNSAIQFYLDNISYSIFHINEYTTDEEFNNIVEKALLSTNENAVAFAEKIFELEIKKRRSFVKKVNDYLGQYKHPDWKTSYAYNKLKILGRKMHTSFLKSLHFVAARIPAQNQLSFMAMEIEMFENPNVNSAYVSTYQFYLQGSDLDIDAVSLQMFALNSNGLFEGHSPYYNLNSEELQKASEQLPFPTGETAVIYPNTTSTLKNYIDYFGIHTYNDLENAPLLLIKEVVGGYKLILNNNSIKNIRVLSTILNETSLGSSLNSLLIDSFNILLGIKLTLKLWEDIQNQFFDLINKHNLYINKANSLKRTYISRNYITLNTYDVIIDPINQREAQSSVDFITKEIKESAAKSELAELQNTFTPHDPINKKQSLFENMSGKDGIAIGATGLKSFFAETLSWNQILELVNFQELKDLMFEVTVGNKIYTTLANIYTDKIHDPEFSKYFNEDMAEALFLQYFETDKANELSALLSVAVDNAKDLCLAKLNASTATLGMYIYGISIGVPFLTLVKIINSKLGRRLNELTRGNLFNNDLGANDIIGALDYIYKNPYSLISSFDIHNISPDDIILKEINLKTENNVENIRSYIVNELIKNKNNKNWTIKNVQDYFNGLRNIADNVNLKNSLLKIEFVSKFNLYIDFIILYAEDVSLLYKDTLNDTVYGFSNIPQDFETLALGAMEMKEFGRILKLNQGLESDPNELIKQVERITLVIQKRLALLKRLKSRHKNISVPDIVSNPKYQNYTIDLNKFLTDPNYALELIDLYDSIKMSYNPLKTLRNVEYFKRYAETLAIAYEAAKKRSSKFKILAEEKNNLIAELGIYDKKLKDLFVTNIERSIDIYYRQQFMQNYGKGTKRKGKVFSIPASTSKKPVVAFIDSFKEVKPVLETRELQLGTTLGDANFKLFLESTLIPQWQNEYPDNIFLRDLTFIAPPKSIQGLVYVSMGLQINMLPKDTYENELFQQYQQSFNELASKDVYKDANGEVWSILELLFLYSLITTNGAIHPRSLHKIFEESNISSVSNQYNQTIAQYDNNSSKYKELVSFIRSNLEAILPFSNPYKGGAKKFKQLNKETEEIIIWTQLENDFLYDLNDPSLHELNIDLFNELGPVDNVINNFYPSSQTTIFNTDYFLNFVKAKDLPKTSYLENNPDFPNLSKFNIKLETIEDTIKIIDIQYKNKDEVTEEQLEQLRLLKYDIGNHFKKGFGKIKLKRDHKPEFVLDLDELNKLLEEECHA